MLMLTMQSYFILSACGTEMNHCYLSYDTILREENQIPVREIPSCFVRELQLDWIEDQTKTPSYSFSPEKVKSRVPG